MPRLAAMPCRLLVFAACLACLPAWAQAPTVRAWLDRDRIALGETTTLNIEVRGSSDRSAPDLTPLARDFDVGAQTSRERITAAGGRNTTERLVAVALQPRRAGALQVPPVAIAGTATAPIALQVGAAPAPARAGGLVFIESEVDQPSPYVQQALGYVVRLHYATQLMSGQLDQDAPAGAALQRIGSDLQYAREIGGRRYTVVERRFLLVPERSGTLQIPAPRFAGRGAGSLFDDFFGDGQRALSATGTPLSLAVRPVPANAPQPWLPLRALSLRYDAVPRAVRAGDAATVVVEMVADGANGAQLPDLELDAGEGAQVFADPPQVDESFEQGRPQVRVTRQFSVVPADAGTLRIAGPRVAWWDAAAGAPREATLDAIVLEVKPSPRSATTGDDRGAATGVDARGADGDRESWIRVPGVQGEVRPWALATVVFALLWLVTLAWGLQRVRARGRGDGSAGDGDHAGDADAADTRRRATRARLRGAIDTGDLGDVADALLDAAPAPRPPDLDALRARLADDAQRDAVTLLQRARWGGGDGVAARAALRAAFADGPRWRDAGAAAPSPLPPLYPERGR